MLRNGKDIRRTALCVAAFVACPLLAARGQAGAAAQQSVAPRAAAGAHHLSGRAAGRPAYLFLWYADGSPAPDDGPFCSGIRPPAYKCTFGATMDECQRLVQAYLDAWYADFNILFTLTRPISGDYYTLIVTSDGTWCQQNPSEAGVAPFNCNDNPGLAAYAFECGASAHACATMIAHEHGHMVGLEHTLSPTDVLNATVLATATGFDNKVNRTADGLCSVTQNSYQQMLAALGAWPGSTKPGPFSDTPDAGAPDTDSAVADARIVGLIGAGPAYDGSVAIVPGFDALARPPLPSADAAAATATSGAHSGCALTGHANSRSSAGTFAWVLLLLLRTTFRVVHSGRAGARALPRPTRRP